jgi:hypothetical protein
LADFETQVRAAVQPLAALEEDDLYQLLALRVRAMERDPAAAGQLAPTLPTAGELGIAVPDLAKLGRELFGRISMIGYATVCGPEASGSYRFERLLATLNKDVATVSAAVAGLLVVQLAIAPAVAAVVATIVVGHGAPATLGALCGAWKSRLPPEVVAQVEQDPGIQPIPIPMPPTMDLPPTTDVPPVTDMPLEPTPTEPTTTEPTPTEPEVPPDPQPNPPPQGAAPGR